MPVLRSQTDLDRALERLAECDPQLARYTPLCQPIPLRRRPAGLAGLLQIILAQQVSVASARAIWQKFEARFPTCDPQELLNAGEEGLRSCSLSRPKIKTVQRIAHSILEGFDMAALEQLDVAEVKTALVGLHGVGPWTADIYLLFCLGESDIFPAGDLALQVAVAHIYQMKDRPKEKVLADLAQAAWAPNRSAAAHLFWAVYRDLKAGREGIL